MRVLIDDISSNRNRARRFVIQAALPPALVVQVVVSVLVAPYVGLLTAVLVGVGLGLWLHRSSPAVTRAAIGGRPADPATEARLHNLVDGLCSGAGVPKPELLVLDDPAPNALSYGLDPRHSTVAVTRGLLDRLDRVELEGVLARELARIKHHDTEPATVAVAILRLVAPLRFVRERIRRRLAARSLSTADANGVAVTRYPPGLASALGKLRDGGAAVRAGTPATAHLWVEPPDGDPGTTPHLSLDERIDALREL